MKIADCKMKEEEKPPVASSAASSNLQSAICNLQSPDFVPAWHELLADSACDEVTLSPEWLLAWWEVFGGLEGRRPRLLRFDEGGRLVGLAPLLARRHWYRPGLPFRRLEMLASGEREEDSICSDYLGVLARRGREIDVARALAFALPGGRAGPWDELVLPHMDGTQPMTGLLAEAGRQAGLAAQLTTTKHAQYIPLPGSWEEYLRQLGQGGRYLVNRSLRDFERWAAGDWRVEEATAETLGEGVRILHALHHERWRGTGGGVFRSKLFLAFHERVMPALLRRGALELLWLVVRGEPVASVYSIRWKGKTSFYQSGRKLDVPRQVRPGLVLLAWAIRRAIKSGQREFDFLGGDERYKKQLALASRPLVQLRLARPGLLERARGLAERGEDLLRPLWRRLRRSSPR
jgi:CelD/BcsL family acetyltransferase involved in cellulose biosynthesis